MAYVDAERTLQGFETFLDEYRALLASMPSGVTYAAPTVWHGVIQNAFTKGEYATLQSSVAPRLLPVRRTIEDARSNAPLTPDQRRQYLDVAPFPTPAFDALYKQFHRRRASRV